MISKAGHWRKAREEMKCTGKEFQQSTTTATRGPTKTSFLKMNMYISTAAQFVWLGFEPARLHRRLDSHFRIQRGVHETDQLKGEKRCACTTYNKQHARIRPKEGPNISVMFYVCVCTFAAGVSLPSRSNTKRKSRRAPRCPSGRRSNHETSLPTNA